MISEIDGSRRDFRQNGAAGNVAQVGLLCYSACSSRPSPVGTSNVGHGSV